MTDQSKSREELLRPQTETEKLADLNEDDILKLIQLQIVFLLVRAFSLLSIIALSTPAVKQQMIVFILALM